MKTNLFKTGLLAIFLFTASAATVSAQTLPADAGTGATTKTDAAGESIKLIDNKGTIKYMQSNNGITTITSTAAGNQTVTTWQLGGTLTDDTYIDVSGKAFALDGIILNDGSTPSTDATTLSSHGTGTGFTLLVRNEVTGATEKLLASDLISGIRVDDTQATDATGDVAFTVTGLPTLTALTTAAKLFVYRNGAKLRFGTDFTVTAGTVTITYSATDLPMYAGDVIEIQYIK